MSERKPRGERLTTAQLAHRVEVGVEALRFYERRGVLAEPPRSASATGCLPRTRSPGSGYLVNRPGRSASLALAWLIGVAACGGKSPDESRVSLYRSSVELKADSAASVAFFATVLGDSVQRERLARVILENEGMRRTLTQTLIADSLARVPGAGLPEWRSPPAPADAEAP